MRLTAHQVLTDIEGTTTSIAFVHETLFPFARMALPEFLRAHADDPEVRAEVIATAMLAECDPDDHATILATLLSWMDADRKVTPLKALQGMIWQRGYAQGDLQSHVYPDVVPALKAWHAAGIGLAVYSSGSVPAQQQLFGHTPEGDLRPLFSQWFDTRVGGKREAGSYARIVQALGTPAEQILFLSDVAEELDAARASGLQTVQLLRAQDGTQPAKQHPGVSSFAELDIGRA